MKQLQQFTKSASPNLPFILDYEAMRQRFLTVAQAAGARLSEYVNPLSGPDGNMIVTDVAFIGSYDAPKRTVIISGAHGVEGAYGSAC